MKTFRILFLLLFSFSIFLACDDDDSAEIPIDDEEIAETPDDGDDPMDDPMDDPVDADSVIFTGEPIVFSRPAGADFTLGENQDIITENIAITRGATRGLFNIAQEEGFTNSVSPTDTEWAIGTTAALEDLTFSDWTTAVDNNPPAAVGVDYVLHLITDDIFIDIRLLSWGQTAAGGGEFSYQRSTPEE